TTLVDFQPSSNVTRFKPRAASSYTRWPPCSPPVNATFATNGCVTNGSPTSAPKPVTTFTTPGGNPACSTSFTNSSAEAEANSDGFHTTVFPAASAGANFQVARSSGEFHGVMAATTPSGSCWVKVNIFVLSLGMTETSILSASPP